MRLAIVLVSFVVASTTAGQGRAVRESERAVFPAVLAGRVLAPDGLPAQGAVVATSAGGSAVTAADGSFELEVELSHAAPGVEVTASAAGGRLSASARVVPGSLAGTTQVGILVLAPTASCKARWVRTFGGLSGTDDDVHALAVFDDGGGPALYAGGAFTSAGSIAADFLARWDGVGWSALAGGALNREVEALAVFDDGSGPALYAGGWFTSAGGVPANRIARWDGASWSALGAGVNSLVHALLVFDDGSGPALYVGGQFTSAGGSPANGIARWDGATWTTLGSGFSGGALPPSINAMAVFDDGSGPALHAAGAFTQADGFAAFRIAKWNGAGWAGLGAGLAGPGPAVHVDALAVFDDGGGPELYVGGTNFTTAGGVAATGIAKWDGSSWHSAGGGIDPNRSVQALAVFDDGGGPALFAGGNTFEVAGGASTNGIARWDGASWTGLAGGVGGPVPVVQALAVFDDGDGPSLFAGGAFTVAGTVAASRIAEWDGAWSTLGRGHEIGGPGAADVGVVRALTVFDDGRGPALYAGGTFANAGTSAANHVARWNGSRWEGLGSGMSSSVYALAVFDDGSGPALYAGGHFTAAGAVAANHIARWDGATWSALGSGVNATVRALAVFDDGSGPALYAAGSFGSAGGSTVNRIAKWDGASWSAIGSGWSVANAVVYALAVFDDGAGAQLYAGGEFRTPTPDSLPLCIAKWDGTSWSSVGGGVNERVSALAVFDDGSGPALYVGGSFTRAGGATINGIARWNGTSWTGLGGGVLDAVQALATFDDGSGPALYAGGLSWNHHIVRWNGTSWSALGSGVDDEVHALAVFDGGNGSGLYVGGEFENSPAGDRRLAHWACASRVRSAHW